MSTLAVQEFLDFVNLACRFSIESKRFAPWLTRCVIYRLALHPFTPTHLGENTCCSPWCLEQTHSISQSKCTPVLWRAKLRKYDFRMIRFADKRTILSILSAILGHFDGSTDFTAKQFFSWKASICLQFNISPLHFHGIFLRVQTRIFNAREWRWV